MRMRFSMARSYRTARATIPGHVSADNCPPDTARTTQLAENKASLCGTAVAPGQGQR
jgi:hypothetical protein